MLINAFILSTIKKIRNNLSFTLSTFTTILQPILWLSIFLYLREEHIVLKSIHNQIRYIDFLVLGIFVWRTVSFIFGKIPKFNKRRCICNTQHNNITRRRKKILIWSSIIATFSIAMIIW